MNDGRIAVLAHGVWPTHALRQLDRDLPIGGTIDTDSEVVHSVRPAAQLLRRIESLSGYAEVYVLVAPPKTTLPRIARSARAAGTPVIPLVAEARPRSWREISVSEGRLDPDAGPGHSVVRRHNGQFVAAENPMPDGDRFDHESDPRLRYR